MVKQKNLEDVLPLTPMQEGMLFHSAYDADGPDVYTVQHVLQIEGPLNAARLRSVAQALMDRHAPLRTAFRQVRSGNTLQVVEGPVRTTV